MVSHPLALVHRMVSPLISGALGDQGHVEACSLEVVSRPLVLVQGTAYVLGMACFLEVISRLWVLVQGKAYVLGMASPLINGALGGEDHGEAHFLEGASHPWVLVQALACSLVVASLPWEVHLLV